MQRVRVAGGVPHSLEAGAMYVTSNHIENFSLWKRTYVPGIFWDGVGNNYSYLPRRINPVSRMPLKLPLILGPCVTHLN